ncbi:hypothetical protein, partial [Salmonella sp. SAL4432]|uniref:hypothetical protein n=1 Tax=Salmonella sp. SAL4432 TaxID=3159887 RepID=UPI0039791425
VLERKFRGEVEHLLKGIPKNIIYEGIQNLPTDAAELAEDFWQTVFKEVLESIVTGKTIYIEHKLMLSVELDAGGTADVIV